MKLRFLYPLCVSHEYTPPAIAEPTLIDYQESDWTDNPMVNGTETTGAITYEIGDLLVCLGATADEAVTLATPARTGEIFSLITSTSGGSNTRTYLWTATAANSSSGTVTSARASGAGGQAAGLSVFVFRNHGGIGSPSTITGSGNKVVPVTIQQAKSHFVFVAADWNADTEAPTATPSTNATEREHEVVSGAATFYVYSWGDQDMANGTLNFGFTSSATVDLSAIGVEIKGI